MLASIILASKNEGDRLRKTLDAFTAAPCATPYEVVVVDDGSQDGSCDFLKTDTRAKYIRTEGIGLAPARNLGASHAVGDMLVFCDAHIAVEPQWLDHLARALWKEGVGGVCPALTDMGDSSGPSRPSALAAARSASQSCGVGCGKTWLTLLVTRWLPRPKAAVEIPVMCGGCFAVRRTAFESVGGYQSAFGCYGWDEEELSIKLWTFGYTLMGVPDTCVRHYFRPMPPYQIPEAHVVHNLLYLAMCHYSRSRVESLMAQLATHATIKDLALQLYPQVFSPDNLKHKREHYRRTRRYSDDWYFERFGLGL